MDWINIAQTLGMAVVVLLFVGWCIVRLAHWAAPRIDKLFDRLLQGLTKVDEFDERLLQVEQRIELLWEFQLRRAKVEALRQEIGTVNSPLKISEEAKSWMKELAHELRAFYRKLGRTLSETQLAEEIERRFGKEIVEKVCLPHGLFQGACLLIAMEVAKEMDPKEQ